MEHTVAEINWTKAIFKGSHLNLSDTLYNKYKERFEITVNTKKIISRLPFIPDLIFYHDNELMHPGHYIPI